MAMNKKVILIGALLVFIIVGSWLFHDSESNFESVDSDSMSYTGNLVSAGSDGGWYIDKEDDLKKIMMNGEDVNCLGDPESCSGFFQESSKLAGSEVYVRGVSDEESLNLERIKFSGVENCNFDFNHFRTEKEDIEEYSVDFSTNPDAQEFETRISEEVSNGPNFAGHYVYAEWGCGSNCGVGAIVDSDTGEIVEFGIMNSHGADFELESKLLVINPPEKMEYLEGGGLLEGEVTRYFLMSEEGLLLLCEK